METETEINIEINGKMYIDIETAKENI